MTTNPDSNSLKQKEISEIIKKQQYVIYTILCVFVSIVGVLLILFLINGLICSQTKDFLSGLAWFYCICC